MCNLAQLRGRTEALRGRFRAAVVLMNIDDCEQQRNAREQAKKLLIR